MRWDDARALNAKAVDEASPELLDMLKNIVESLPVADEVKVRLALHMATVYRGSVEADPTALRTFCAVPTIDVDEKLAETPDGTEYLRLRGPKEVPLEVPVEAEVV